MLREHKLRHGNPDGEALVFDRGDGKPYEPSYLANRSWKRVLRTAGIRTSLRWHDLRHTFASHFMMSGGSLRSLQTILGHTEINMTLRYAHLSPSFLAEEIGKVDYGVACFES